MLMSCIKGKTFFNKILKKKAKNTNKSKVFARLKRFPEPWVCSESGAAV